jgi:hypothetical protein
MDMAEAAKKKQDKKNPLADMPDGAPGGLIGGGKKAFDNKPGASKADAKKKTQKTSGAKKSK